MKLTLKNIKELKINATPLEKRVLNYIIDEWGNYDDKRTFSPTCLTTDANQEWLVF